MTAVSQSCEHDHVKRQQRADDHDRHADIVAHISKCHFVGDIFFFLFLPLKLVKIKGGVIKNKKVQGALLSSNGIHYGV